MLQFLVRNVGTADKYSGVRAITAWQVVCWAAADIDTATVRAAAAEVAAARLLVCLTS